MKNTIEEVDNDGADFGLPDIASFSIRNILLRIIVSVAAAMALYIGADMTTMRVWNNEESLIISVIEAGPEEHVPTGDDDDSFPMLKRRVALRVLSGAQRGMTTETDVVRLEGSGIDIIPGRRYLLVWDEFEDGTVQYSVADAYRVPSIIMFAALFCLLLTAFAGRQGALAVIGLAASMAVLLWWMVPMIAAGWPPTLTALAAVLLLSLVTVLCVVRHARYRPAAFLGSVGGVLCGFALASLMVRLWQLAGLSGDGAALLASTVPGMDMRGVMLAAVLIGSIGAVLDVGISVAASMAEIADYAPGIPLRRLWLSGISVGSEMLGSMINTLVFAYLGCSLPMALLISTAGADLLGILNDPYIGQEIVQSLAGTAGLLFTVPVTAAFFVMQVSFDRRRRGSAAAADTERGDDNE